MARLAIKVVARSSADRVAGKYDDSYKIQVRAPAEGGRANEAVLKVLADALGVKVGQLQIISGHTHTRKVVGVEGLDEPAVAARLAGGSPGASRSA
jgi:uncharacterized protein YggU (UPF0235/DUF167 family)